VSRPSRWRLPLPQHAIHAQCRRHASAHRHPYRNLSLAQLPNRRYALLSAQSAAIGGAGHLVNFWGTDTMAAILMIKHYYGGGEVPLIPGMDPIPVPGISIPAAEHSTITSWGRDGELAAMRNMLTQYPDGLVAVVSDSYDVFNACKNYWGKELKELIMSRPQPGGRLVVRPDSGDPPVIVVQLLDILGAAFEEHCTKTSTGFKVLPPQIRLIQGDGISYETLGTILEAMKEAGWAAENVAFGSGGALLQKLNRDTQKCAFKCSEVTQLVDGESKNVLVFKDPITDPGKQSKKGRLTLEPGPDGKLITTVEGQGDPAKDVLVEVFRDGQLLVDYKFEDIRKRAQL
jgi:nicotinamide phosphoribosyltransferase